MTLYEEIVNEVLTEVQGSQTNSDKGRMTQIANQLQVKFKGTRDKNGLNRFYDALEQSFGGTGLVFTVYKDPRKKTRYSDPAQVRWSTLPTNFKGGSAAGDKAFQYKENIDNFESMLQEAGLIVNTEDHTAAFSSLDNKARKEEWNKDGESALNGISDSSYIDILKSLFQSIKNNQEKVFDRVRKVNGADDVLEEDGAWTDILSIYRDMYKDYQSQKLGLRVGKNPMYSSSLKEALERGSFNEMEYIILIYLDATKRIEDYNAFVNKLQKKNIPLPESLMAYNENGESEIVDASNDEDIYAEEGDVLWSKIYSGYGAGGDESDRQYETVPSRKNKRISSNGLIVDFSKYKKKDEILNDICNKRGDAEESAKINAILHIVSSKDVPSYTPVGITWEKINPDNDDYKLVAKASFYDYTNPDNWGEVIKGSTIEANDDGDIMVNGSLYDVSVDHKSGHHGNRLYRKSLQLMSRRANAAKACEIKFFHVSVKIDNDAFNEELAGLGLRGATLGISVDDKNRPCVVYFDSQGRGHKSQYIHCHTDIMTSKEAGNFISIKDKAERYVPYNPSVSTYDFYAFPLEDIRNGNSIIWTIQNLALGHGFMNPMGKVNSGFINNIVKMCTLGANIGFTNIDTSTERQSAPYKWVTNNTDALVPVDFTPRLDGARSVAPITEGETTLDKKMFKGSSEDIIQSSLAVIKRDDYPLNKVLLNLRSLYDRCQNGTKEAPIVYKASGRNLQFGNQFILYMGGFPGMDKEEDLAGEIWRPGMFINDKGHLIATINDTLMISNYGRVKANGQLLQSSMAFAQSYPIIAGANITCVDLGNTLGEIGKYISSSDGSLTGDTSALKSFNDTRSIAYHKAICATWNAEKLLRMGTPNTKIPAGKGLLVHHIDSNPHHCAPTNLTFVTPKTNTAADNNIANPPKGVALFYVGFDFMETAIAAWPEGEVPSGGSVRFEFEGRMRPVQIPEDINSYTSVFKFTNINETYTTGIDLPGSIIARNVIFRDYDVENLDKGKMDYSALAKEVLYYEYNNDYYLVDEPFSEENNFNYIFNTADSMDTKINKIENASDEKKNDYFATGKKIQHKGHLGGEDEMKRHRSDNGLYRDNITSRMHNAYKDTAAALQENIISLMDRMGMRLDD